MRNFLILQVTSRSPLQKCRGAFLYRSSAISDAAVCHESDYATE